MTSRLSRNEVFEDFSFKFSRFRTHSVSWATAKLSAAIKKRGAFLTSRFGTIELSILNTIENAPRSSRHRSRSISEAQRKQFQTHTGFFPTDDQSLQEFYERTKSDLKEVDLLGVRDEKSDYSGRRR
jgi:hypothetical protein